MRYARLIFIPNQMIQHKDLFKLPYNVIIKEIFRWTIFKRHVVAKYKKTIEQYKYKTKQLNMKPTKNQEARKDQKYKGEKWLQHA